MRTSRRLDRVVSTASWIIVFFLFIAVVSVWTAPPTGAGLIGSWLGVHGAQVFYSVLYFSEAAVLAYSKTREKNEMRKNTLLVIYLTGFFTTLSSILVVGWSPKFIDNLIFATCAAFCWLYWKFKTEYVDPEFADDEWSCRDKPELD